VKNIIKYPTLVGRLRDSIKGATSVNNVQMSTLENIIINISIAIKKELKLIMKNTRMKEEI
jgi:hypothetical protein|tara:strand:- start:1261 stop:1443 length:183 start_codon:yes stop_codon:yes gene_type:complete